MELSFILIIPILSLSISFISKAAINNKASVSFKIEYIFLNGVWGSWFEVWGRIKKFCISDKQRDKLKKLEEKKEYLKYLI